MSLDLDLVHISDSIKVEILDNVNYQYCDVSLRNADSQIGQEFDDQSFTFDSLELAMSDITEATLTFLTDDSFAEVVILAVSYLKNGAVVGSSLVQNGSCELKLLKYKVELPRGAKVTLFDDAAMEAKYLAWNLPCPTSFPNMTFLQVKAANGFEQQLTPSAGSQTIELYTELGRRYAVFGEIWTYSFAQTLWFADLRVQLSDNTWQNCTPIAGEGGTIVTTLPQ